MNEKIATLTNERENWSHYLIDVDDLVGSQKKKMALFLETDDKFGLLGYTTYEHSTWAVRVNGEIQIWRIPFDPCGRWVMAKCRTWNQDQPNQ